MNIFKKNKQTFREKENGENGGQSFPDHGEEILRLREENKQLKKSLQAYRGLVGDLSTGLETYMAAAPVLHKLNRIAENKTENAVVSVTDEIFSIAGKSSDLGVRISAILSETFTGTGSLKQSTEDLAGVSAVIDNLNIKFGSLLKEFADIFSDFKNRMGAIISYLINIEDLSEETNLLAINTAIEAARMGRDAGGFTVISKAIQELSNRSRRIAVTIEDMIRGVDSILENNFSGFSRSSKEFGEVFDALNENLEGISNTIRSRIISAEDDFREAEKLPESIKNDLHGVIENLQFQDITRQIQQHIVEVIEELNLINTTVLSRVNPEEKINQRIVDSKVLKVLKNKFTVEEEWKAAGIEINEKKEDIVLF